MQNLDKVNPGTPETYLNIGGGFRLLVGSTFKLIAGALGTGGMTNSVKASIGETWGAIASTWAGETRTWEEASQLIGNVAKPAGATLGLVDSYTNYQGADGIGFGYWGIGQSFTGNGGVLDNVQLYIARTNNAIGTVYARIYAETHATAFGTDSKPTGTALAVSDGINVGEMSKSISFKQFTFSGANRITLANGTKYVVTLEWRGNPSTYDLINVGYRYTSATHAGNLSDQNNTSTWTARATVDMCFKVYELIPATNTITNQSKP